MRVETTFTSDGKMIITYPHDTVTETDYLKTGKTRVSQDGKFVIEWDDMPLSEFCKRQNLIIEKGQIVKDGKPRLKDNLPHD